MTGFQEASLFEGGFGHKSTFASDLETFQKKIKQVLIYENINFRILTYRSKLQLSPILNLYKVAENLRE